MRKLMLICLTVITSIIVLSKSPDQFSYQALVRDAAGNTLKNKEVSIRFSVLKNAVDGTVVYTETQKQTTNDNGLLTTAIGKDTLTNRLGDIKWGEGTYFLKTEIDIDGGSNYSLNSVNQLVSVPYAIYAEKAKSAESIRLTSPDGYDYDLKVDNTGKIIPTVVPQLAILDTATVINSVTSDGFNLTNTIHSAGKDSISEVGVCWSTSANPTVKDSRISGTKRNLSFTSIATGLNYNTTYYIRPYATNSAGVGYGKQIVIKTPCFLLSTPAAITGDSVAVVNAQGKSYSIAAVTGAKSYFWKVPTGATIASGQGTASITVNFGTQSGNVKVCAVNECDSSEYVSKSIAVSYPSDGSFTGESGNFTDSRDGITYKWVKIGNQIWMAENLKAVKYRNGDAIPNVTANSTWAALTTGAWCDYINTAANGTKYGHLYNWYAVNDSRNIAPAGWHVATDAEWSKLTDYLGGENVAGGKLKETGTLNWLDPNTGATNETGFSALPDGARIYNGTFSGIGNYGYWWNSGEFSTNNAWGRYLDNSNGIEYRYNYGKMNGFSVRCVKDAPCPILTTPVSISGKDTVATNATAQTYSITPVTNATTYCWKVPAGATIASGQGTASITVNFGTQSGDVKVCAVNECDSSAYVSKNVIINASIEDFSGTSGTFTDSRDGITYKWVKIGNQIWMAENLKAVKYRNGDAIPSQFGTWSALTTGARDAYYSSSIYAAKYGLLYNWYAVNDARKIAPVGWHVPSDAEWSTLTDYMAAHLGTSLSVAKSLAATTDWAAVSGGTIDIGSNRALNNSTGFSALPGGYRSYMGTFLGLGNYGYWWSSTVYSTGRAWCRYMYYNNSMVSRIFSDSEFGYSVRCIKD